MPHQRLFCYSAVKTKLQNETLVREEGIKSAEVEKSSDLPTDQLTERRAHFVIGGSFLLAASSFRISC